MINSQFREHLRAFRMPQLQQDSQTGELEWIIIWAESQCKKDQESSITSSGKNRILNQSAPWVFPELL